MIRFFTQHPTAANLLMLFLLFIGFVTLPTLKRETLPEIKQYKVEIKIIYPGATPTDIEEKICVPLENAIEGISFVEEISCQAHHSYALAIITMFEVGDFLVFMDDVNSAVDEIDNFPVDSEEPRISEVGRTQDVVTVAITADIKRQELKDLAEQIKAKMLLDPNIPLITIEGFAQRQFQIQISQEKLRQYGISLYDIANVIDHQNIDLPVGEINTTARDYQIRFNNEAHSIEELGQLSVLRSQQGTEIHLADIATIIDQFDENSDNIIFNGKPAAFLKIRKNSRDDSLRILEAVELFIEKQRPLLPVDVGFYLTQDFTSGIKDRIQLLIRNAWQGLLLVFGVMWLFFGRRYAFWVVMGLPVSFLASTWLLAQWGVSINMLSMVALLLALGILMDDAIVISESIGHQISLGKSPTDAAIDGTQAVARGVLSSFITTLCIFTGLLFLSGDIGQNLKTIPLVLISVISVSLVEAFLILPHHLKHSLEKSGQESSSIIREKFTQSFNQLHGRIHGWVTQLIRFRYAFIGSVIGLLLLSVSLLVSGIVKFSAFPDIEGDILQARVLMPVGSSLSATEQVVQQLSKSLTQLNQNYKDKYGENLVYATTLSYGMNADAFETGAHVATVSADLLTSELRHQSIDEIANTWRESTGNIVNALSISIKEPIIGPAGRAIYIQLQGEDLKQLSHASHQMQNWLKGYSGVSNIMDDLRPGKPEFTLHIKQGAYALGLSTHTIAMQLRAAYQGIEILETNVGLETFEVVVILDEQSRDELADFDYFPIIHPETGQVIPLSNVADIIPSRDYSHTQRINGQQTVTIYGDIDPAINNTQAILQNLQQHYLPDFAEHYPEINVNFEGEIKEGNETRNSMRRSMLFGLAGIFILLSLQFRSYIEPLIVMVNIPLALIGVIGGHLLMGHDITMPSLLGFVSLAGIVVNDSILLVEFVKKHNKEGMIPHESAAKASVERFRAVFLTSITTIAGLTPLLFEQSPQAQILIPLAISIIFGIATSTLLVLFVVPCLYCILEDFGFVTKSTKPNKLMTNPYL